MERVSNKSLIERFNGKIPDGTHFTARNLEDFIEKIENHTLTTHKEIILVEFQNPIKAKICGNEGIGYFYEKSHNPDNFTHIHNELLGQNAKPLRIEDNTIQGTIPIYGHQDLFQNKLINGEEFIIQKPSLYFLSILEMGTGYMMDLNMDIGIN